MNESVNSRCTSSLDYASEDDLPEIYLPSNPKIITDRTSKPTKLPKRLSHINNVPTSYQFIPARRKRGYLVKNKGLRSSTSNNEFNIEKSTPSLNNSNYSPSEDMEEFSSPPSNSATPTLTIKRMRRRDSINSIPEDFNLTLTSDLAEEITKFDEELETSYDFHYKERKSKFPSVFRVNVVNTINRPTEGLLSPMKKPPQTSNLNNTERKLSVIENNNPNPSPRENNMNEKLLAQEKIKAEIQQRRKMIPISNHMREENSYFRRKLENNFTTVVN
ncbi:hypothetical protein ABK040_007237 [Willaertia magna]